MKVHKPLKYKKRSYNTIKTNFSYELLFTHELTVYLNIDILNIVKRNKNISNQRHVKSFEC